MTASGQATQHRGRVRVVPGFTEDVAVDNHGCVRAKDHGVRCARDVHCPCRFLRRQTLDVSGRSLAGANRFVDVGRHRLEVHAGRAQQVGTTR